MRREPLFPLSRTSIPVSQQQTWNLWNFRFPITLLEFLTTEGNPTLNHKKDFAIIHATRDQFKGAQLTNLKNGISKTSLPTIQLEYIGFHISNPPFSMISGIFKTSLSKIYPEYLELPISNPPSFMIFRFSKTSHSTLYLEYIEFLFSNPPSFHDFWNFQDQLVKNISGIIGITYF